MGLNTGVASLEIETKLFRALDLRRRFPPLEIVSDGCRQVLSFCVKQDEMMRWNATKRPLRCAGTRRSFEAKNRGKIAEIGRFSAYFYFT